MRPNLSNAVLIVAHPDDEVLWFGSIVGQVGRVVMCFGSTPTKPGRQERRRRVVQDFPLNTLHFLDMPEPGPVPASAEPDLLAEMIARLREQVRGAAAVFTHNPWGEYGHRDHLRVHAAVVALQAEFGFDLYVSCYLANPTLDGFAKAIRPGVAAVLTFPVDQAVIAPILALYLQHQCWTWHDDWVWPVQEHFFRLAPDGPQVSMTALPLLMIRT